MFFTRLFSRPSSLDPDSHQQVWNLGSIPGHCELLHQLGFESPSEWLRCWQDRGGVALAASAWPSAVADDWIWGLAFPLLSALESASRGSKRSLVGLSGLPGCGKTSLANWIRMASQHLGVGVAVVSLDDFYWPSELLEQAIAGNPWSAPRALPGSHDIDLMARKLNEWRQTGVLVAPCFDKSRRGGRGDRSGWFSQTADVLLFEGWFLGAEVSDESLDPPLTPEEKAYRPLSCTALSQYERIWEYLDSLWHLRAPSVSASGLWKSQQEATMHERTGVRLDQHSLERFVRMIETALPQKSLQSIPRADVVVELTQQRSVHELRLL